MVIACARAITRQKTAPEAVRSGAWVSGMIKESLHGFHGSDGTVCMVAALDTEAVFGLADAAAGKVEVLRADNGRCSGDVVNAGDGTVCKVQLYNFAAVFYYKKLIYFISQ